MRHEQIEHAIWTVIQREVYDAILWYAGQGEDWTPPPPNGTENEEIPF